MKIFLPATAIALTLIAASCTGQKDKTDSQINEISDFKIVQTVKTAERSYLCQGAEAVFNDSLPVYSKVAISVQWPEEMGNANISPLQDSIKAAIFEAPKSTIDDAIIASLDDPEGNDIYKMSPVDSIPENQRIMILYRDKIASAITFSPQYIVYQIMTSLYSGGAHGISVSEYINYDFDSARVITPKDAFRPESDEMILTAIKEQLMLMYGVTTLKDLDNNGIFSDQIFISPNFYLQGYSVVFHYNPYDIAPYSTGSIDVAIPYYKIQDALTPEVIRLFRMTEI